MPLPNHGKNMGRYLVRSDDVTQLTDFINDVNADPDMELLDTIGPVNQPHTIVVAMPHTTAHSLQQRFSTAKKLIIEPDRPLSLFEDEQKD